VLIGFALTLTADPGEVLTTREAVSNVAAVALLVGLSGAIGAWVSVRVYQPPRAFGVWMIRVFLAVTVMATVTLLALLVSGGVQIK
jgi:hypothetical protein